MEAERNEQIANKPHAAEAEKKENGGGTGEISFGKFKDAQSLLNAYNSLEAEFTKRCQRLKELEGERRGDQTPPASLGEAAGAPEVTPELREKVVGEYLKELFAAKSSAVVLGTGGMPVTKPVPRPKTIDEAGKLALELIEK